MESLPVILNNLRMVHTMSRHYSQLVQMTQFLQRIANQLILRSKQAITSGGKLWDLPKLQLIDRLTAAERLYTAFMVR